ncbi:MAG: hypothetical protein EZS28_000846 [Streblomastix strix]|uniref:Uncharacterized protein n=1 Tax=Streblomastix strix TaxID=222440 RepID=A0A5J4X8Z0_9EUKA|nr:MAG: hypothetical protein EZS28_000846 [Streblomastix strix]
MKVDRILLKTDNTAVEYCPGHWKPASALIHLARIIFQLLETLNISLVTEYIINIHNNKTDALSKMAHHEDYSIIFSAFSQATTFLQFIPTIDLFASRTMKRCERYCGTQLDQRAVKRNAISFNWTGERPLIDCPVEMIPRVLNKIHKDQIEALLILSHWSFSVIFIANARQRLQIVSLS